ncbi:anthranilate synthase component II [Adhaeribacter rhizoryzae]|uniref:Aminodeoxychorismate/anthranilate synthase component II n=1 Tax=Adhaeribacter rhizoryzae TaxID=2607907 RepID=A0A5M6DB66_9BACT|nr:aminodeoxychorismate/anthranilate synthase component II [Adhaeribacter rhizoryzae]KAA5544804.1 aminodeoxychorismate/anthranilate synthase component II [Adhaeribacter rhizoryzae]
MKILVLDNYDSFTYNLVQLIKKLGYGSKMDVYRNDKIELNAVEEYDNILLSPGPGVPAEAGIMPELIKRYAPTKKIFGVCLGHQAIAEAFGGSLLNLPEPVHGVATPIRVSSNNEPIFRGLPHEFKAARYHSWVVVPKSMPHELEVTAVDNEGQIMALRHREYNVKGVQFHPESILTEHGDTMMRTWLKGSITPKKSWI